MKQENRPLRWGMVADDLTGACDASAPFARCGLRTIVLLDESAPTEDVDLLTLSTGSRADPPEIAREKTRRACHRLAEQGASVLYKKIDSTLKGNIGAEIEAALEVGGQPFALLAPAFPAMGRCLQQGSLHVKGVPSLHLPSLLREQGISDSLLLSLNVVREGALRLAETFRQAAAAGIRVVVADAIADTDLEILTTAAFQAHPVPLLVGSAGLAAFLAERLAAEHPLASKAEEVSRHPALLCIGSENPVTAAQVDALVANGQAIVVALEEGSEAAARKAFDEGVSVVVPIRWQGKKEATRLRAVLSLLKEYSVSGLALSGGDTAALVCGLLGTQGLRIEGEVTTGLPVGRLLGGEQEGMRVCAKAGGFGEKDALLAVVAFLQGKEMV